VAIAASKTLPRCFSSAFAFAPPWIFCSTRGTTTRKVGLISASVATTWVGSERWATRMPACTESICRARARMWESGRKMTVFARSCTTSG